MPTITSMGTASACMSAAISVSRCGSLAGNKQVAARRRATLRERRYFAVESSCSEEGRMLTLTNSILFENITVYRDDVNPARFYVLPPKPDIARDADGEPKFAMVIYRHDEQRLDPTK